MLIEKFIFHLPQAIRFVSRRYGIPSLRPSCMFTIYALKHLGQARQLSILSFARSVRYELSRSGLSEACTILLDAGLISEVDNVCSITPLGRSFLADIRLFLKYKRLK